MEDLEDNKVYEDADSEEYSSSDEDIGGDVKKNLENSINKQYLLNYHPEVKQINYNELQTLMKVVRNKNGKPIDPLHKTLPILTKYEKAKILGLRSKQINSGSEIFVEVPPNIFDGYTIANMELEQKKIPFIIRRPLPNGSSEFWSVNDLQNLE
jgi:DNA-directed RNA polymerases I, II, and III subunit RPABC2